MQVANQPNQQSGSGPRLSLRLLGGVHVTLDDEPIAGFESDLVRALLAYLAVERDRPHRREALTALFWPEQPDPIASHRLSQALSNLRQVLRDGAAAIPVLLVTRGNVQLNPAAQVRLDVAEVTAILRICQEHHHRQRATCGPCLRRLDEVVALYSGPFLAGFVPGGGAAFQDWAATVGERLHQDVIEALLILAAARERRGAFAEAAQLARRVVQLEAWNEPAQRQLMRALALGGQRAAALRQFQVGRRVLARELGLKPAQETVALHAQIRTSERIESLESSRPRQNLPLALSSFVGRETEITEIQDLLACERLVTLTGVGGSGKTRLALYAAGGMVESFPDGVWLIELAALTDPGLVVSAVAQVLGLREQEERSLQDHLQSREALLILDNREHLIEACAHLAATLLRGCPRLTILATSREPLQVRGERVVAVPPLRLPDRDDVQPVHRLLEFEAVRLFVERVRAVQPEFALDEPNARAIIEICRRLDGLPLAIELAAARSSVLTPAAILERLTSRGSILTGGARDLPARQQTLRATIAWSYDLLEPAEQTLFRRLAVFAGGFTLEDAEAMVEGEDMLELLARLVGKSLVVAQVQDGQSRYRFLETIREYAWECLEQAGEVEEISRRHRAWYIGLLEAIGTGLDDERQVTWVRRLAAEHDNLRIVLAWCRDHDPVTGLRLATSLASIWADVLYQSEGRKWLEGMLARVPERTELRARALMGLGEVAGYSGIESAAQFPLEESLGIYQELGDKEGAGQVLAKLGEMALNFSRYQEARNLYEQALTLLHQSADPQKVEHQTAIGLALLWMGDLTRREGDDEQARVLLTEGLEAVRRVQNQRAVAITLAYLGDLQRRMGHPKQARESLVECLRLGREIGHGAIIGHAHIFLAVLARTEGDYRQSRVLLGDCLTFLRKSADNFFLAWVQLNLGKLARAEGDNARATASLKESLVNFRMWQARDLIAQGLAGSGELAIKRGASSRGVRLIGAATAVDELFWTTLDPDERGSTESSLGAARRELGEERFAEAMKEGQGMTLDGAIGYALEE